MKKKELVLLIENFLSLNDLSIEFDKPISTIRYWLKKYGLKTNGYKKIHSWNKESLLFAISNSECKSDVLRSLNIKIKSGNFQTLDRYCFKYNIDISHLKYKNDRGNKFNRKLENKNIFIENSLTSGTTTKRRVIKDKLLKYKCEKCGNIGKWQGETLVLQLDHKNGINIDNRLDNLRFLCPNCHSQTPTYGSRKKIKFAGIA